MPRIVRVLPPLLLVVVALHQIWLVRTAALNPWSGGGFGMFATTDVWGRRHLHSTALHAGIRRELEVPKSMRERMRQTLTFPTEARMRSFARAMAPHADPRDGPLDAIGIQVIGRNFDRDSLAPSGEPLGALREEIET